MQLLTTREKKLIAENTKLQVAIKELESEIELHLQFRERVAVSPPILELRRAIAIYCREECFDDDWENDQHAIDWFTGKYTQENYE